MPGCCARCKRQVYYAEQQVAINQVWHTFCFSCCACNKLLDQLSYETDGHELYCHTCFVQAYPPACCDDEPPSCLWPRELTKSGCNVKFCPSSCSSNGLMYNPCGLCTLKEPGETMHCTIIARPPSTPTEVNNWHARKNHNKPPCGTLKKPPSTAASQNCSSRSCPPRLVRNCSPDRPTRCSTSCPLPGQCYFSWPRMSCGSQCSPESCQCGNSPAMCPHAGSCSPSKPRMRSCSPCQPAPCVRPCSPQASRRTKSRSCPPRARWPPSCCDVERAASIKSWPCSTKTCVAGRKVNFCDFPPQRVACEVKINDACTEKVNEESCACDEGCTTSSQAACSPCASSPTHCHCASLQTPCHCAPCGRPCRSSLVHACAPQPCVKPCRLQPCAESPCVNSCRDCKVVCRQPARACLCSYYNTLFCKRCNCKVYHAERVFAANSTFHNSCFSCFVCRTPLSPMTLHEANGEIYCRQCLVRNFGPKGYGYAGTLQSVE